MVTYFPQTEVEAALRKCKALAFARGKQAGRDEATQFVQWAAQLNGSTHAVLKALGTDPAPRFTMPEADEGEPDHAEVVTLALIDALLEAKTHHPETQGGPVYDYLLGLLKRPDDDVRRKAIINGKEKYGCLMADLPSEVGDHLIALGRLIPDSDLGEDGREDEPHVTVRYGFHDEVTTAAIASVVETWEEPLRVRLDHPECFYGKDSGKPYDVIVFAIDSEQLHYLHDALGDLPHTDTHSTYRPHATVAYVKAGLGDEWLKKMELPLGAVRSAVVNSLVYSDPYKTKTTIEIGNQPILKAFQEDKHPRDDGGRFVSKEAIHAAKSDPKKAEALRERVTDPEQRKKLDAAIAGETDLGRTKAGEKKEATAKTREEKATRLNRARELANEISMARRGGAPVPPEHFTELAEHLPHMTVADLRSTRVKLAASFGGGRKRDEMVAKLTAHAKQRAEELNAPEEEPVTPAPADEPLDFGMFDVEGEKDDPRAKEPVDELQGRNRKRELLNTLDAVDKTGAGELPSDVVKRVEGELPPALEALRDASPEDIEANKGKLDRHDAIEAAARGTFGPEVKAAVLRALEWDRYQGSIAKKHAAVGEELRKLKQPSGESPNSAPPDSAPADGPEKSAGHVGFDGPWEYFKGDDGQLYRAKTDSPVMTDGRRFGRWEAPAHMADARAKMLGLGKAPPAPAAEPSLPIGTEPDATVAPQQTAAKQPPIVTDEAKKRLDALLSPGNDVDKAREAAQLAEHSFEFMHHVGHFTDGTHDVAIAGRGTTQSQRDATRQRIAGPFKTEEEARRAFVEARSAAKKPHLDKMRAFEAERESLLRAEAEAEDAARPPITFSKPTTQSDTAQGKEDASIEKYNESYKPDESKPVYTSPDLEHVSDIARARDTDKKFRGEGRYEAEVWQKLRNSNPDKPMPPLSRDAAEWLADGYERDGKPIPDEVLKDNPDLRGQYEKPAAPPASTPIPPAPSIASQNRIDENVRDKADRVAVAKKFRDTGKLSASEADAFIGGDTQLTAGNAKWKMEKAGEALGLTPEQVQHAIANTKPSGTMKKPGRKPTPTYHGSDFLRTLGMVDEPGSSPVADIKQELQAVKSEPPTTNHKLQITPQQPIVGDKMPPPPKFGPDMNVIEGQIGHIPITTSERGMLQKLTPKTVKMLEDLINHPETKQALEDAGITHIQVRPRAGSGTHAKWSMGHSNGVLMIHPQSGNHIEKAEGERKERGAYGILHHEAGHGLWNRASESAQKAFESAIAKYPDIVEQVGKIVNIKPPKDSWNDDPHERMVSEAHAELHAMRKWAPQRYAALPEDLRQSVEGVAAGARPIPEHIRRLRGTDQAA